MSSSGNVLLFLLLLELVVCVWMFLIGYSERRASIREHVRHPNTPIKFPGEWLILMFAIVVAVVPTVYALVNEVME